MGYIDFSSKYYQIPRFITATTVGFFERSRRFLWTDRVFIEISIMDGHLNWFRSIDNECFTSTTRKSNNFPQRKSNIFIVQYIIFSYSKLLFSIIVTNPLVCHNSSFHQILKTLEFFFKYIYFNDFSIHENRNSIIHRDKFASLHRTRKAYSSQNIPHRRSESENIFHLQINFSI